MSNFKNIINDIIKQLENIEYQNGDLGDVGNNIGIAVGKYIQFGDDKDDFLHGINHGISLVDGTHDN